MGAYLGSKLLAIIRVFLLMYAIVLPASASTVMIAFDVDVYAKYDYLSGSYDPSFQPVNLSLLVTFDGAVRRTSVYANEVTIDFGVPFVSSLLTATLPYGPGTTAITQDPNGQVEAGTRDYGIGHQWSEFVITQNQYDQDGPNRFWTYHLGLNAPTYPPLSDPTAFGTAELLDRLAAYKHDNAEFTFSEYTDHYDSAARQYLGGVGYTGRAYVADFSLETPEPNVLTPVGLAVLYLAVRRWPPSTRTGRLV